MNDIPKIIEDLYYQMVVIPDQKDWPESLNGSKSAVYGLYSFYYGLRIGFRISEALHREDANLSAE